VRFVRLFSIAALVLFAVGIVRADDTRVNMNGGGGGSPACGSNVAAADGSGALTADCLVTNATGAVTTFSFEVLDANTLSNGLPNGGLTCASQLSSTDGWTGTLTAHNVGGIDICTLTAPTTVSSAVIAALKALGDAYVGHNDGDCDLDDFVLGIPVGCDIKIDSATGSSGFFAPNTPVGFAVNGNQLPSLPEPGTLALLLVGLTGLPLLRRKFAR
jgi:hypothetical protein